MLTQDALKAQEQILLTDQSISTGSFMSKQYYLRNKPSYGMSKISSKVKVLQVGNGANVKILFKHSHYHKQCEVIHFTFCIWSLRYMTM